jgi:hypothetical protein
MPDRAVAALKSDEPGALIFQDRDLSIFCFDVSMAKSQPIQETDCPELISVC